VLQADEAARQDCSLFKKGGMSMQLAAGGFESPFLIRTNRPEMDYVQTNLRIGWMLDDPGRPKYFFRGNWEGLLEFTGSHVDAKTDGFFTGAAFLLRYNVLSIERWRLFPYFQTGAGLIYNDVYKDKSQSVIGQAIEFTLRSALGFRFMMTDCWSIDLEGAVEHISNAGFSNRNSGLNAGGGFVGISRFF
jgi:hypothetical protein